MDLVQNSIESLNRDFSEELTQEYIELYTCFGNKKIEILLSTFHAKLSNSFNSMNIRLPTRENTAHFWADSSRELLKVISGAERLQRILKNTAYCFSIVPYYEGLISNCKLFLDKSGGSVIPAHMDEVELYYTLPIFIPLNSITINSPLNNIATNMTLSLIGEGSYAYVYKYKDDSYNRYFVLKRAKKDLNTKELERFTQEFDVMRQLISPYIVEVYSYNGDKNEYLMEYMDYSLYIYIQKNNDKLTLKQRKNIGNQILAAFSYLSAKNILHRDISLTNILVKEYEHTVVVKISDFGLVKLKDSHLTSANTDFKGSLNDQALKHEGFANYSFAHEIYALTQVMFYILTGRTNLNKTNSIRLKNFVLKGMNPDKNKRFIDIQELSFAFNELFSKEHSQIE